MSPKRQIRYEILRAQHEIKTKSDANKNQDNVWINIFHILCYTYGWTLEYVANLNLKQVNLLLKTIHRANEPNQKTQPKDSGQSINSIEEAISKGLFKNKKG